MRDIPETLLMNATLCAEHIAEFLPNGTDSKGIAWQDFCTEKQIGRSVKKAFVDALGLKNQKESIRLANSVITQIRDPQSIYGVDKREMWFPKFAKPWLAELRIFMLEEAKKRPKILPALLAFAAVGTLTWQALKNPSSRELA